MYRPILADSCWSNQLVILADSRYRRHLFAPLGMPFPHLPSGASVQEKKLKRFISGEPSSPKRQRRRLKERSLSMACRRCQPSAPRPPWTRSAHQAGPPRLPKAARDLRALLARAAGATARGAGGGVGDDGHRGRQGPVEPKKSIKIHRNPWKSKRFPSIWGDFRAVLGFQMEQVHAESLESCVGFSVYGADTARRCC